MSIDRNDQSDRTRHEHMANLSRAHSLLRINPKEALSELEKLAAEGSVLSMIYIGETHQLGHGVSVNLDEAEKWFVLAERAGSARASYMLGRLYLKQHRYDLARAAFERGTEQGFAPAIHNLGRMYVAGTGTEKNLHKGEELLRAAVARGSIFAKSALGQALLQYHSGIYAKLQGILLLLSARLDILRVVLTESDTSDRLR